MDLIQRKLTKLEWDNVERPVSSGEKEILNLIIKGYDNPNFIYNNQTSLISFLKIDGNHDAFTGFLYKEFFEEKVKKICKKYEIEDPNPDMGLKRLNSGEQIKINNSKKYLSKNIEKIFEFCLINLVECLLRAIKKEKQKDIYYFYYTLHYLRLNKILYINQIILDFVEKTLTDYKDIIDLTLMVKYCPTILEGNEFLNHFKDYTLYNHQKQLFSFFRSNRDHPKLALYIAPTGTGKTLSPLGLSCGYRVIFLCAARHVGLALAKSAISLQKKVAFAFGCNDSSDIRLNYLAASSYYKHERVNKDFCSCGRKFCKEDGKDIKYKDGKKKIIHTDGSNVEIMICDIKSYLCAMHYMVAFNDRENIITYWDEPTITMDKEQDDNHVYIHDNWSKNIIPNLVLCSATLPPRELIYPIIQDFKIKFPDTRDRDIISHDCNKSIPLINKEGFSEMPHTFCETFEKLQNCIQNCNQFKTLYRYFDLNLIVDFIFHIDQLKDEYEEIIHDQYFIENYFGDLDTITMNSIKEYYLMVLKNISSDIWEDIFDYFKKIAEQKYKSSVLLTTKDANTLTDGPTIYLADDVKKVSLFLLQQAKIPDAVIKELSQNIDYNNKLIKIITEKEKFYEDKLGTDADKDNKMAKQSLDAKLPPELRKLKKEIDELNSQVKMIDLTAKYVPNSEDHIKKWTDKTVKTNEMTSDISNDIVEKIMLLDMEDTWKVLLLMGVGVMTNHGNIDYNEIMKSLADSQKLYLILASSDYIYGTNYQFCHGFIGKDLEYITQEKTIQAMGRIGRNQLNKQYSIRLRENSFIEKIFLKQDYSLEAVNMIRLFTTDE
jgi:hypothetical protein